MPDPFHLFLFVAAGWLLNLTPGLDVLYIVTHSLRGGWRKGFVASLGITAGCFVHVFAAALGIGAVLSASATAFTVLKWVGTCYLVWIGIRTLLATKPKDEATPTTVAQALPSQSLARIFLGGFWTNALNPKVVLFFLAFLPQFIAPAASDKTLAFLALGALFNLNSVPINVGWALAAAWMAKRAAVRQGMHWLDKVAGLMFVGFGIRLALADRPGS